MDLDELHQELCCQIAEEQCHYQGPADAKQIPALDFKVKDHLFCQCQVLLNNLSISEALQEVLKTL